MRSDYVQQAKQAAQLNGLVTTAQPFLLAQPITGAGVVAGALQPCTLAMPGSNRFDQRKTDILISGFLKAGADTNATIQLYAGVDPVAANNTLLATSGAIAVTAASGGVPFWMDLTTIFDSIALKLCGRFSGQVGQVIIANTLISNQITLAAGGGNNEPPFQVTPFVTFSVANAGTYALLKDFGVEG